MAKELKYLTDTEVICRQGMKIESLEERLLLLERAIEDAKMYIYCIGGPLNDNKLNYSKNQLTTFANIANCLDI